MHMYEFMKIVNNKFFFCYELFKVLSCPFGSLDHDDSCGSKSPSYHDAFSSVSSIFMNNSMKLVHNKVFFIEIILSPATAFWISQSWKIQYAVEALHA